MFSWQPALSVPESEVKEQSSWLRCGEGVKMMPLSPKVRRWRELMMDADQNLDER